MTAWRKGVWMLVLGMGLVGCSGGKSHLGGGLVDDEQSSTGGDGDSAATPGDTDVEGTAVDGDDSVSAPGTDASVPYPVNAQGQVLCGSAACACSDGVDNDTDDLTDLNDPECVSSWDNDEGSFATGISGDNRDDACQDCFFDGNSGSGNDGCRLPTSCLTEGTAESGHGSCSSCEQPEQCVTFCEAYTPNGCDCFGCCTVRLADDTTVHVALSAGCQIDGNTVGDGCSECVPNDSCNNNCGRCELCPGKTVEDLPADCLEGGDGDATPAPACEDGAVACSSTQPCDDGYSCDFGCCVLLPTVL